MTQQNLFGLLLTGVCCFMILAIIYSIRLVRRWYWMLIRQHFSHKGFQITCNSKRKRIIPPRKLNK